MSSMNISKSVSKNTDITQLADEELLKLSIEEPSYFAALMKRYEEAFMRAALSITRSREEAEDILQEAFTKIYTNGTRFKKEPGASFKSWAYKILINTSFTHYQKLKKTTGNVSYLDPVLYDEDAITGEIMDVVGMVDYKDAVAETIVQMPEHLGRLLKYYYLEDRSYRDIAAIEKISTTTLKMRLFRAKRLFKKLLKDDKQGKVSADDIR